ncbi:MAG: NDP-sugar synthase [Desulfomonile tiedjei]|uniref:NDP-sugar synthase n=1 Tax=Desulfomonile tiedjei TaxID=2358 RepID=A0A9D6UY80_9BACT|nr:NDP-sugar synthase [Desulfomonile tiedjei]
MKAMILTAGLGTRLRPLTLERAKPSIPLLGKPLVVRLLEKLASQGATEFRLNLHHLPASIEKLFLTEGENKLNVSFSHEPRILGTAGGLKANESFFQDGTFLMVNGDIVMEFPLEEALAFHRERKALATLILFPQPEPARYFPVHVDRDGRFLNFKGISEIGVARPDTYVFTGVHILEPKIFRYIPDGEFFEINDQVYPQTIKNGEKVLGFPVEGYWNDVGDPVRYLEAQRDLLSVNIPGQDGKLRQMSGRRFSPGAAISESAEFGPCASAGPGSVIEAGSTIQNSILWENVHVKAGASVVNCIVSSGVTLEGEVRNLIVTGYGKSPIVDTKVSKAF